jgi:hypothetical protein
MILGIVLGLPESDGIHSSVVKHFAGMIAIGRRRIRLATNCLFALLSSALASKDQGGSPDHANRLFAPGSIRMGGQMLCPSRDRDLPWRE